MFCGFRLVLGFGPVLGREAPVPRWRDGNCRVTWNVEDLIIASASDGGVVCCLTLLIIDFAFPVS
jgi:hypothetical protein